MRKWLDRLYLVSCWFGACCIGLICLLVVCQVMLNLIDRLSTLFTGSAIGLTIPSYADFTGFLLAASSFTALAYSLKQGAHIRVSLVIGWLPDRFRRVAELWCLAVGLFLALYFSWFTANLTYESYTYHDLSFGMIAVPIWIPQSAMLFGLAMLSLAFLDEAVSVLRGKKPSYSEQGENILAPEEIAAVSGEKEEDHV